MALNALKYSSGPVEVVTESDPAGLLLEAVTLRLVIVVGTAIIFSYLFLHWRIVRQQVLLVGRISVLPVQLVEPYLASN